ncbi:hypothetical protein GGS26DRAFT_561307 [Hypomontagnella submonticulosa]|nr:hypothetical protein GGS26DRAFT_561307 [Hypomontagnella submonticulosa]
MSKVAQDSLYITLQYLRTVEKQNKYHWGLFASGSSPPSGHLLHASDTDRAALDLYQEVRRVRNPLNSRTMVVVLKIADSPGLEALKSCASSVHLMDPNYLPQGESRWTCRVWVKELMTSLHRNRYIELPSGVDTIEQLCQNVADHYLGFKGIPKLFNDLSWMNRSSSGGATLLGTNTRSGDGRYYGSSPMDIDPTTRPYYGSSPMVIDSTGDRYYGPSPMVTETHYYR